MYDKVDGDGANCAEFFRKSLVEANGTILLYTLLISVEIVNAGILLITAITPVRS